MPHQASQLSLYSVITCLEDIYVRTYVHMDLVHMVVRPYRYCMHSTHTYIRRSSRVDS